jgi:2-octaprenyl-6-methoxyphenol hydroxylase
MAVIKSDVVVIGAGLNGLVAALALGGSALRRPLGVMVIDRRDPRLATAAGDSRGSALTRATQNLLQALGVWAEIQPQAQEMREIIVTDDVLHQQQRPALLTFLTEAEKKAAAAIVENGPLTQAVLHGIEASPRISLKMGLEVEAISFGPGLADIQLSDGNIIRTPLIIGADGRSSKSRDLAGIKTDTTAYDQAAITLTVAHDKPHEGRAEEHFTSQGVFAILPLTQNRSSIVWVAGRDEALAIAALDDQNFLTRLREKFGAERGALSLAGPRHVYPLALQLAQLMIGPRLALVGDAAHVIHPLAGLGLNLGFKDVAALADLVSAAAALGEDIGGAVLLEKYQMARRFDTVFTAHAIDGLNRLFATDEPGLKALRDLGLRFIDTFPPAKNYLMGEASGLSTSAPSLMRGLLP